MPIVYRTDSFTNILTICQSFVRNISKCTRSQVVVTKLDSKPSNKYYNLCFAQQESNIFQLFNRSTRPRPAAGRSEVNFETNVDQDISALAARTHAEQGGSSSSSGGRRRMQSQQDGEAPGSGLVTGVTALERAAQGGSGFQTVGLDLGVLGSRNNVDDEIRSTADSRGIAGGSRSSSSSYNTQQTSGGRQASSSSSSHGYAHSTQTGGYQQYSEENNNNADEYGTEEDYDENEDEQGQSGTQQGNQGSTWSRSSSYSLSHKRPLNAQPGSVDQQFKHYPHKRDVSDQDPESPCKSTNCGVIRCVVGPIEKNNGALVALRTRLVAHTLHKVSLNLILNFSLIKFFFFGSWEVKRK